MNPTTTPAQPEALAHAAGLESFAKQLPAYGFNPQPLKDAAATICALHAQVAALTAAPGVQPLGVIKFNADMSSTITGLPAMTIKPGDEFFLHAAPAQPAEGAAYAPDERAAFEAQFPVPGGVSWNGSEYVVRDDYLNSYSCDRFVGQWAAWQARASHGQAPAGAAYISPVKTVADLVNNLLLMDQTLPVYGAQYIEHEGRRRAIAVDPTVSRERVKGERWIGEGAELNAAVIWTRAEQPAVAITWSYCEIEARIKELMAGTAYPNSNSVAQAMKQLVNELWQRYGQTPTAQAAPAAQDHAWGCRANAFGDCTCKAAPAAGAVAVPRETLVAWRQWCAQSMSHAIEHEISDWLAAAPTPAAQADSVPQKETPDETLWQWYLANKGVEIPHSRAIALRVLQGAIRVFGNADSVLEDATFEAVRKQLCTLPRYSFVLDDDGLIRRVQDRVGNWIEFDDAHELFDPIAVDAARKQGANHD